MIRLLVYAISFIAQVSALRSSKASSPRRFRVMGSSIGSNGTVRSRGGVRTTEDPLTKAYPCIKVKNNQCTKIGLSVM